MIHAFIYRAFLYNHNCFRTCRADQQDQNLRDLAASTSQALRLKVCTPPPGTGLAFQRGKEWHFRSPPVLTLVLSVASPTSYSHYLQTLSYSTALFTGIDKIKRFMRKQYLPKGHEDHEFHTKKLAKWIYRLKLFLQGLVK